MRDASRLERPIEAAHRRASLLVEIRSFAWASMLIVTGCGAQRVAPQPAVAVAVAQSSAGESLAQARRGPSRQSPPTVAEKAECPDDMALIEAASFVAGSTRLPSFASLPVATAHVSAFCLDRTEVSVAAFRRCVAAGICAAPEPWSQAATAMEWGHFLTWGRPNSDDHPVNGVSCLQAQTYCLWSGLDGGARRLPREIEWELAAVGREGRSVPWATGSFEGTRANLGGREIVFMVGFAPGAERPTWSDGFVNTAPVQSLRAGATPEGVLHLLGNVAEWIDPSDSSAPNHCHFRGSDWSTLTGDAPGATLRSRGVGLATSGSNTVGFRCARDPLAPAPQQSLDAAQQ